MFSRPKRTPVPTHPPSGDVAVLAEQLSTARGRLELLGGDAASVLTEVPSESELAEQRGLAEWKRGQLRRADRAELSAQLDAAEAIREAEAQIREADIRDAIDARKALAAQRRADTPASTIAELHRYSRWTRYGCAAIIAAGMLWSAVNVQHNMAPGGTSDPMFWVSFLVEGMISGLLVIIAIGTAKNREAAGVEPSPGLQWAEVGLFVLTLALNTYPYLAATHWYQASLHGIAPCLIGGALLVLHYLGKDYTRSREIVARRITSDASLHLPDLRTLQPSTSSTAVAPSTTPAVVQQQPEVASRTTDPIAEFEAEFDPAPEPALTVASEPAPHFADEESAVPSTPHRTSPEVRSAPILDTRAGSAVRPHFESAGSEDTDTVAVETAPHQPSEESADTSAGSSAPVVEEAPEPARTETSTTSTSTDADEVTASAGEVRDEVRAPRVPRTRTAHPPRTGGAGSSAPASAGSRTQAALALSPVESAGTSAGTGTQVRASMDALAGEVRARGAGGRLPVETVVRVLEALDRGASVNAAHTATGVHRRTVERIRDTAAVLLAEAANSGTGGRVIELRKTDRT